MQWLWRAPTLGTPRTRTGTFAVRARFGARAWTPRPLQRIALLLAWLALCLGLAQRPATVRADAQAPRDLVTAVEATVPALPPDFLTRMSGRVKLAFHPQDEGITGRLIVGLPKALRVVADELGVARDQALEIRIARSPAELARLAPQTAPPPAYAVGVAYPALGLIVLSVVDPQSFFPPNLGDVLTHELSHILLYRAAGQRPLPLWFVEGLAVHQAGEQRLSRVQTLWEAAVVDDILTTAELSQRFPTRPRQVNLAYAQSADLVEYLLRSEANRTYLVALLREVKQGRSFEQALLSAYGVDLPYLEHEWRRSLGERYRVLPMVLTGTALWGGIAVLVVIAFIRRRRDQRQKLSRWAEEEAREDRVQAERSGLPMLSPGATELSPELFVIAAHTRDSAVPTIEHEGQRYTLH
jgi:Peptidase MA superfamily